MDPNFSVPLHGTEEMAQVSQPAGSTALWIFSMVVLGITFVVGVVGNGLVIWIAGFRMARTVTTICYLNLALADFSFMATLPFLIVSKAMRDQWPFGGFLCKLIFIMVDINLFGSIFLIAFIALDRCICVRHPVWAQNHRTVGRAMKLLLGPWVLAFILTLPVIIFQSTRQDENRNTYCTFDFRLWGGTPEEIIRFAVNMMTARGIIQFIIGFCLPMSMIAICYGLIASKIRQKGIKSSRPLRLLTAVVASFFLCWFPFQLVTLLVTVWLREILLEEKYKILIIIVHLTRALAFFNSCLNPLLYVFVGQDFRDKLISSLPASLERALSEDTASDTTTKSSPAAVAESQEL